MSALAALALAAAAPLVSTPTPSPGVQAETIPEPPPAEWREEAAKPDTPRCVKRWRTALYAAHAADLAATAYGIERGKLKEANPLLKAIGATDPLSIAAAKVVGLGFTEWQIRRAVRSGEGEKMCTGLAINTILTSGVVGWNVRLLF